MNLRDLVKTSENSVSAEARVLSDIVRNPDLILTERLAAFEDIMNLEVGDTSLVRSKTLERDHDVRQIYLKMEGDNPTGTQKDRIGFAQVYDALRREYDSISLATCGNYGVSVALASKLAGISCKIFIPSSYHTERLGEMEDLGAEIFRLEGRYEDAVTKSSQMAMENEWYDANPGSNNTALQLVSYAQIAFEIYDQLRDAPAYCAVPVSNGTLLAGIYRGFVSLHKRGKTSKLPRMIAASSTFKNPIIHSFNKNLPHCADLDPNKIRETALNEPLINWHSFDGEEALQALRGSNGLAYDISDKNLKQMATYLAKKEALNVLPASTAGLIGLLKHHQAAGLVPDRYVAIITAKR